MELGVLVGVADSVGVDEGVMVRDGVVTIVGVDDRMDVNVGVGVPKREPSLRDRYTMVPNAPANTSTNNTSTSFFIH